jgi:hypothetical protein
MEIQDTRYLPAKMEEEEEGEPAPRVRYRRRIGFSASATEDDEEEPSSNSISSELVEALVNERALIINSATFSPRYKRKLLEENRRAITVARGGRIAKTENVVYGILIFGGILLVTLSLLNIFGHLPTEITLSFVGTVLGGVIATIAQKLGRL